MSRSRVAVFAVVALAVIAFFVFDLGQYLDLEYFKSRRADIERLHESRPLLTTGVYFLVYVAVTGLSLPGATLLTLAGGAIFGLAWGVVVVSFASTAGATVAFLVARFLFRDAVQSRFGRSLSAVNRGIEREGAYYLFTLRLVPAFPFFVINAVMALTPIRTFTFAWVSQLGMLAGTVVYVNAGTQIGRLESPSGILSPVLIGSFVLLGVFPLVARRVMRAVSDRRALAPWARPARFERDVVVIGAGSGGLVSSLIAAAVRAKVSLVEKHRMGGDCLYTGCVPSKALIRSAKLLAQIRDSGRYGIRSANVEFDFAEIMERVQSVVRTIEPHDSVERYEGFGVECVAGEAMIESPFEVRVGERIITTRNIVIATGGRPFVPPIPGIEDVGHLTSDTLWDLRELPSRLVVLGGGPIGVELAQCFARFGSEVTLVEMAPRILIREDPEVSELVAARLHADGVRILAEHRAVEFDCRRDAGDEVRTLRCEHRGETVVVEFDSVLVAVGRRANTEGFGIDRLGLDLRPDGTIEVDEFLTTRIPNVYACGDVTGPYQFTHVASHQAWFASVNALFGGWWRIRADYSVIPWATFCDPEVARVGLNETEARERDIEYEVTRYAIDDLDRAVADGAAHGFVKVLTVPGKDRILGATIVGEHAGDIITEFVSAMSHGFGLNKILGTIHIYPTLAESSKFAAGVWKRAHAPERVLAWLGRYHAWRRGS